MINVTFLTNFSCINIKVVTPIRDKTNLYYISKCKSYIASQFCRVEL